MSQFQIYSRGPAFVWRQSDFEIAATGSAAPRPKWMLYTSRSRSVAFPVYRSGAASAYPTLSDATVTSISTTAATPRVTISWP